VRGIRKGGKVLVREKDVVVAVEAGEVCVGGGGETEEDEKKVGSRIEEVKIKIKTSRPFGSVFSLSDPGTIRAIGGPTAHPKKIFEK
jgi:hypothetical protein